MIFGTGIRIMTWAAKNQLLPLAKDYGRRQVMFIHQQHVESYIRRGCSPEEALQKVGVLAFDEEWIEDCARINIRIGITQRLELAQKHLQRVTKSPVYDVSFWL